jgi:hypothetical protein
MCHLHIAVSIFPYLHIAVSITLFQKQPLLKTTLKRYLRKMSKLQFKTKIVRQFLTVFHPSLWLLLCIDALIRPFFACP